MTIPTAPAGRAFGPVAKGAQVFGMSGPLVGMSRIHTHRASPLHLVLPVGLALALAFALGARSSSAPPLQLGTIVVADGTATVNGTVGGESNSQTLT